MKFFFRFSFLIIIFSLITIAQPKSVYLDGIGDRLRVTDATPIHPGANSSAYQITGTAITIEAWIFPTDVPSGDQIRYIINRPATVGFGIDPYQTFGLMILGDAPNSHQPRIGFAISDGTNPIGSGHEVFVEDTAAVKVGEWTHVAGTYDGVNVTLYINGTAVRQIPFTEAIGAGSTGLYIGGTNNGYFQGLIDDVRLWNVVRTQNDIQSALDSVLTGNESGLAGYWPMDSTYISGSDVVTIDKTSNHNDLVVQFDAKLLPFPHGSTVQIMPKNFSLISAYTYALTGELFTAKLTGDGWPKPTIDVTQKPLGMGIAGDSILWIPSENQFGSFTVIATVSNSAGTITDTVDIFSEATRAAVNDIHVDVTHRGKLGAFGQYNKGIVYKGKNGLFTGDFSLVDRNSGKYAGGLYTTTNSFRPLEIFTSLPSRFDGFTALRTSFSDDWESGGKIGVKVIQTVHSSTNQGDNKYVIVEYKIINQSGQTVDDLFPQLSTDFDIGNYSADAGGYDSLLQMSYGFEVGGANDKNYYGFSLLNKQASGAAVVNNTLGDVNYFRSTAHLTQFIVPPLTPSDIRNQISTGPFTLNAAETLTVAFAVLAGDNLNDLRTSAARAKQVYVGFDQSQANIPVITGIKDIPNDNGRQVRLSWKFSPNPAQNGIVYFGIWRNDPARTFMGEVPSLNDTMYSVVVPTLFDSTKMKGMFSSVFQVTAHSANPSIYSMSAPDSGYSLDNLNPQIPGNLNVIATGPSENRLNWKPVPDEDLFTYKVYRSTNPGFVPEAGTFLGYSADTVYIDQGVSQGTKYYYTVTAVDFSGNESSSPSSVTSVGRGGEPAPEIYSLSQNYPNPFNPTTTISFGLPRASNVKLIIYDALGREVASLVNGHLTGGYYQYQWDASGLSSGMYIYRLTAVSAESGKEQIFSESKKLLLTK